MSDIHVTYDGDTHWLQCFSDDPEAEKGVIVDPIDIGDSWVTLAEKVAEHQAQHGCAPEPKPEPAKVIVVTERDRLGRVARELRYDANQAEVSEYGILRILRKGRVIGEHQGPGGFSWREEGAIVNDGPADKRKLAIALPALEAIASSDGTAGKHARQALEDIADVDL